MSIGNSHWQLALCWASHLQHLQQQIRTTGKIQKFTSGPAEISVLPMFAQTCCDEACTVSMVDWQEDNSVHAGRQSGCTSAA